MFSQSVYQEEYNKCRATSLFTPEGCSDYAMCVATAVTPSSTIYDCSTGVCDSTPSVSPITEQSCWIQYVVPPPTYPSSPVDTGNDDPPTSTDPPPQEPPCDPYYDCKSTSKPVCILL